VDEAGYALRDVVLNTCDIALPYLKRVQDAMFPDPSRMNMKKRLTTKDVSRPHDRNDLCIVCVCLCVSCEIILFLHWWLTVAPVLSISQLEAMYEKEAREIQQIQQRSMQERERERKDREAKRQREALKGEFIKKVGERYV
jgi:hypothetical protein